MMGLFLFNSLNQFAGQWVWLDTVGIFFAKYFEYSFLFGLFVFLIVNIGKYWKTVTKALLAGVLVRFLGVGLIRLIYPISRPFVENQVNLIVDPINSAAFPSGHASFYFALAGAVFFSLKNMKKRPSFWKTISGLFVAAALFISVARVFVGLHWPLDIAAGMAMGIFFGWLVNRLWEKLYFKNNGFSRCF